MHDPTHREPERSGAGRAPFSARAVTHVAHATHVMPRAGRTTAWWSRRTVAWLGGLFIAAMLGQAAYDIRRGRLDTISATERELDTQSRVIAEQTARGIQAVDVVLKHLSESLGHGELAKADSDTVHQYLKEQAVGLVQADGLVAFHPDGTIRAVSQVPLHRVPPINVAEDPPFARTRDDPNVGLRIDKTQLSLGTRRWVFPIGRRVTDRDGRFLGVVGAPGKVEYFQQFYRDSWPDPSTRISLAHRDGWLLARNPPADAMLGKRLDILDTLLPRDGATDLTIARLPSPIDGVDHFVAVRVVPDYPLVVAVSRDAAAALAPWRQQALATAARVLALGALAAGLLWAALRQLGVAQSARKSLEVSEERYALAMTGSNEGHWLWDIPAGQVYVSAKLAEMFGLEGGAQVLVDKDYFASIPLHPDDAERVHHNRENHVAGLTERLDHEFRIVMPGSGRSGGAEVRWVHTRAQCFRDADGAPVRLAGATVDITQRKRAEEALRSSEQRFALAVEGSDDGVWDFDYVHNLAFGSRRARELNGLPLEPEVQTLDSYYAGIPVHPDDQPIRLAAMQALLDGRSSTYGGEWRCRQHDGAYRWVRVRGICVRDSSGKLTRMAGSVSDIDARKRAEEAQRESQQRFAVAVAGADAGIWEWDFVKGNFFSSRRGRELIGLPPQPEVQSLEAWGAEVATRIHPDDQPRRRAAIEEHLAGRTDAYDIDFRVRRPDGGARDGAASPWRWVHVHGRCERDADGRPIRMAGSTSDIDDRKRTEEALRESEERYMLAMTGSRGGHWVWEVATDRLFGTPAMNELFGLPAHWQPQTRSEYSARMKIHPDDVAHFTASMRSLTEGRAARADYEFRIVLPDGATRWILTRAQRFEDTDGRGVRIAGVSVDISDRKTAEFERERLHEQLRQAQKLEAIGTLAGGIAHDFNNILSAILGYGELAQKGAAEGSAQRRHLDAAIAAGQRAKALVERILAFSRSGMGERVPVHVQSVVDEALDGVTALLPPGVKLHRDMRAGDAGVLGDATQIHQVVMNLCANAIQAMKVDGRLEVMLEPARLDVPLAVTTRTLPPGDYLRLGVADTGTGMAPALVERIFDPFFTTKEVGVGTGLGLSLVHGIVTDLGGGIAVASRVGEGSTFTVYLPSRIHVAAGSSDGPCAVDEHGDGQTVLLVDDEETLVRLGEETLAELGYEPVGFVSATAALAAFRADPDRFDILLSDEAMPGLTGSQLAQQARALRPALPVVLMSGFVTPELVQRARDAGVADVVGKPLAAQDLARALAGALRGLHRATT